ncbi:hypothetical protein GLOTRDRAFT_127209 [Gloeophyllum trabeum ATCC 11539]|uniref:Fungal-type protein kinase domain-containing protein n=1 Tax=Gloeophyllum trabeum (strain ATCC 11539 / FP-39264 / Madison 617) TaxID=670483 RepID=S7QBR9_GLOTA|nr:uncharacterized protein GLOTRDRAFT_127209 [Gloeophyllum trabeum ATCC 11539]EPQ56808.1 hypothetical protein GLOTRDRAFT_127209 [Gloeophyllum trabeum ATCC 11539]
MNMDIFLNTCFPDTYGISKFKDAHKKHLQDLLADVKPGPKYNREKPMYQPICDALKYVFSAFKEDPRLHPLAVHDVSSAYQRGDENLRLITPDIAIEAGDGSDVAGPWTHALGIIEVKPDKEDDPAWNNDPERPLTVKQTKTFNQVQEYGAVAFQVRPRCYLLGVGFYDDVARFYRWDRSVLIFSEAFNYKKDCTPLVKFLNGFAKYGNMTMGIDSTIKLGAPDHFPRPLLRRIYHRAIEEHVIDPPSKVQDGMLASQSFEIAAPANQTETKSESYTTIGGPLFKARSLQGRGTKTWLAVPTATTESTCLGGKEIEQCVIIKDSWREADRLPEKTIYDRIHESGHIFGVARCRAGFDVESVVEESVKLCHRTCAASLNARLPRARYRERIHYRCVLESVGIPLSQFSSTRQLVEAVRDAVKGLRDMSKRGILHRDISVNNIMISARPDAEYGAVGFIIDPEYATFLDDASSTSDLRRITGTIQFISIALQRQVEGLHHHSWHDLESVYWVTLYVVVRHVDTNVAPQRVSQIFDNKRPDGKLGWLHNDYNAIRVKHHRPLTQCLRKLGKLVASHHLQMEESNLLTYENVLEVLQDALNSKKWPRDDPATRPFKTCHDESKQRELEVAEEVSSAIRSAQASGISYGVVSQSSQKSSSRKRKARDVEEEDFARPESSDAKRVRSEPTSGV